MLIPITLLATALLSAGMEPGTISAPSTPIETRRGPAASASSGEPPLAEINAGGEAPDFSYQGWDGRWRHLHDVLEQGAALLVFGADEDALRALERERVELRGIGVVPVAVLDVRPGRAAASVRRLGLGYSVLADPRRVIAAQFNSTHPTNGSAVPAWFVIDRTRRVRALDRGRLPQGEWATLARNALALALPDAAHPAAR